MAEVWVSASVAAAGVGVSLYGAEKNAKAQQQALQQNKESDIAAQNENWRRYLLQRGIDNNTGGAVNTRLPLWAGVIRSGGAAPRLVSIPGPAATGGSTPSGARGFATLGITPRRRPVFA